MAKVMKQIQQRFEMSRRSPGSRKMDLVILLQVLCMRDYTAVLCEMKPKVQKIREGGSLSMSIPFGPLSAP